MENVTSVFKNAFAPITRSSNTATGFGIDLFLETVITWLIRYMLNMRVPFSELIVTIGLAAPLMGIGSFKSQGEGQETDMSVKFLQGVQTVPSLFLSQYIVGTMSKGLYVPKLGIWSVLITMMSRIMSRVVISYIQEKKWLGETIQDSWLAYTTFQKIQMKGGLFGEKVPAVRS